MSSPLVARLQLHAGDPVTASLRDDIGGQLNEAFVRGDLDADTYRRLLSTLYEASAMGELVPVAEALPRATTYAEPAIVAGELPRGATTGDPTIVVRTDMPAVVRARGAAWLMVSLGMAAVVLVVAALLLFL